MKKLCSVILILLMILSLTACGGPAGGEESKNDNTPSTEDSSGGSVGLSKDSVILLEQIRTIDKRRLREHMGHLDDAHMSQVNDAIAVSFGLNSSGTI